MADIVQMPMASQTMEEGKVVKWLKKEGDSVKKGEELVEIETDKTVMAIESFFSGIVKKIIAQEGDVVPVLKPIAVIGAPDEEIDLERILGKEKPVEPAPAEEQGSASIPKAAEIKPAEAAPPVEEPALPSPAASMGPRDGARIKISPAARRVAKELSIDVSGIRGTGPGGRIVRADVYAASQAAKAATAKAAIAKAAIAKPIAKAVPAAAPKTITAAAPPQPMAAEAPGGVSSAPMSRMRQAVAQSVIYSKQTAPEFTVTMEVDMGAALEKQKQYSERAQEAVGIKVTINDLLVKAAALALREFPLVNSRLNKNTILTPNYVNIGVVVGLDEGMVIPVIEQADIRSVIDIARESKRVISLAKEGKSGSEAQGTFTITNLGMFGVDEFTAIIHSPESAILAVGAVQEKAAVINGGIHIRKLMKMTISADHRILDGVIAAKFLARMKEILEKAEFE